MIKAVLLDLDHTLLGNPTRVFVRRFMDAWTDFLAARANLLRPRQALWDAVDAGITNEDPTRTVYEVSLAALAKAWTLPVVKVSAHVEAFYREAYPQLKTLVTPRPEAPALLDWLLKTGYQVAIATNPIYPAEAVVQRLTWAGLPTDLSAYALVTHMENVHFAKPAPQYYEEILGRLGVASDEAVMVGDDWRSDIAPAERAGLNTFWVRDADEQPGVEEAHPDGQGTLQDFARRVSNEGWLEGLKPHPLRPEMIAPRLSGNVAALFGLLADIEPDHWHQRPDPDEWSPLEVIYHLRDSERTVQRPRLQRIAAEDDPFISAPLDPPGPGLIPQESQDRYVPARCFAAERQETIAFLKSLPPAAWNRPARHSIFGPTTLLEMAAFTATHDRLHLRQICQTAGRCL